MRYVTRDEFFSSKAGAAFYCHHTIEFEARLAGFRSGIGTGYGEKNMLEAVEFRIPSRTTKANGLCIVYGYPLETDPSRMKEFVDAWNEDHADAASAEYKIVSRDSIGCPTKVGIILNLNELALAPSENQKTEVRAQCF